MMIPSLLLHTQICRSINHIYKALAQVSSILITLGHVQPCEIRARIYSHLSEIALISMCIFLNTESKCTNQDTSSDMEVEVEGREEEKH